MSEFLAEARILVRPDTTKFRAELVATLAAATRGVTAPIQVIPVTAQAGLTQVAAQTGAVTAAINERTRAEVAGVQTTKQAIRLDAQRAQSLSAIQTATVAQGAALTGLRGAVLTASGAFLAATVGIQAFSRSVQAAAQLESDLNVFRVTAGATAEEMERVREEAGLLGRDLELPGVAATDAAQTFLLLSRAGLSVEESLAGARGTLQLATAAQIEFSEAAQLTSSALNAFQLSGDEAITVADLLTNAANASQASITEMGIALRQSSAIAAQVGFSVSETATFLTQLARAGLAGSDAGTSFRVAMQRLIAPTDKAREQLENLNINLRDAQGNLRPEAFFELADALDQMSRAQADATRQMIFGNDASRAAAFFGRLNAETFRELEGTLTRAGAAAEVAAARNEGFSGSVENLRNQITALGIEIGELSLPILGVAVDGLAVLFGTLADQIAATREAWRQQVEDIEEVISVVQLLSDESGFTDFVNDVTEGARLINQDIENATGAIGGFIGEVTGLGGSADDAGNEITELTEKERLLAESIHDAVRPTVDQNSALRDTVTAAQAAAGAIARLTGQIAGLNERVTRARIGGDQGAELGLLEQERERINRLIAIQEDIVAEGGRGAATARASIRNVLLPQLEGITNEINAIRQEQATNARNAAEDAVRAAEDAARAQQDADRAFIDALSTRREDIDTEIGGAAAQDNVRRQIRLQDQLQALIKQQITKIRAQVRDENLRKAAIRELRLALIASRREEEELRQEQREAAQAARAQGIDLDIQFAEITGNVSREVAARQRLIALLKKQQAAVKKGTAQWKQLRNEIATQQQAIKDAQGQAGKTQDSGKTAQQFFFEQLQAQQGFASNLLGNLITGPTQGLVGIPPPTPGTTGPGRGIAAAAALQEGKEKGGPTAGQANTTNNILLRMLRAIEDLNRNADTPEAVQNKRAGSAVMDGIGGGSGSASVM